MREPEDYILLFYWIQNKIIKDIVLRLITWSTVVGTVLRKSFPGLLWILLCPGKSKVKNLTFLLEFWP